MRAPRLVLTGILGIAVLAAPIVAEAQPALEEFRFDPPQLCLRDLFRWGFSYRGLPGGLAAVKDIELSVLFERRSIRSPLSPPRVDLQRYATDQGRFERSTG